MKPRTSSELASPDRVARAMNLLNPATTPRWLRNLIRENYVSDAAKFLYDTMKGTQKFEHATMVGTVIEIAASPPTRVKAAAALIEAGLGKTIGFEEGGMTLPGVFALPELDLRAAQALDAGLDPSMEISSPSADNPRIIFEDADEERSNLEDRAPGSVDESDTVNPAVVRAVLAKRNGANGNGKH